MASDGAPVAEMHATADQGFAGYHIVLKPISHPELGDIHIDESLFAIGRTEAPFASYAPEIVADLSRRHARIFSENGAVYIADLDSKNGTTVNGVNVRQKTSRLNDGDEIRFGQTLSYRVRLGTRSEAPARVARLLSLTLSPERGDLGLQPIVITQFPFLISKVDATFSRYQNEYPHQVNYISRRHAHIFLKGGSAFIEDLGSTNGTFVDGRRLDEHAVALKDGDLLGFGGHHFVYEVSLQKEEVEADPTVTKLSPAAPGAAAHAADADKTTFVAAADSFLNIFCVDHGRQQDDELNDEELKQAEDGGKEPDKRQSRSRFAILFSELIDAFAGNERTDIARALRWGAGLAAVLAGLGLALYLNGAPERELKDLLARGDYAQAAAIADRQLERAPGNGELKALGVEALLKANVPQWSTLLKAREFDRAATVLADMKRLGSHNADVQPLLGELEWIADLEKFVAGRGGTDAPIRIYADEEKIKAFLKRWDEDTQGHQRTLARISSYVPEFRDPYAEALSHLRKLQSDDAVYLAAIERLKTTIAAQLDRDLPEALDAALKEYADKYPRLGGLDSVRQDLRQYMEIDSAMRAQSPGLLIALLARLKFSTPPFQARLRALTSSGRLPSAEVVQQYEAVSKAWHDGNAQQALAGLQKMAAGPWAAVASKQLEHKKVVMEQFAQLQKTRDAKGYDERLLSFYGLLDPDEDVYYLRATEKDLGLYKDKALGRAQELLNRAQERWRQYRENGAIEGGQRLDAGISAKFRSQARLLSDAHDNAQQGMRIYKQLKAELPAQWNKMRDEINAETELQRRSLLELRGVLEPGLLKTKLELLGGAVDERQSP